MLAANGIIERMILIFTIQKDILLKMQVMALCQLVIRVGLLVKVILGVL